ncbi:MAG: signal peptidase I [Sulfobacillus benefaciens]|uniref:Signal peptidase I n=1 Tax=Sulfobacillus benefaciens TaxID=453960 RepID=A0A2T2X0W2_9FIRM|nr:MAG: signal peptidase I [Sulfobacillus benefaciens]
MDLVAEVPLLSQNWRGFQLSCSLVYVDSAPQRASWRCLHIYHAHHCFLGLHRLPGYQVTGSSHRSAFKWPVVEYLDYIGLVSVPIYPFAQITSLSIGAIHQFGNLGALHNRGKRPTLGGDVIQRKPKVLCPYPRRNCNMKDTAHSVLRRPHTHGVSKPVWKTVGKWSLIAVFLMIMAFFIVIDLGDFGVQGMPDSFVVRSGSMTPVFNTGSLVVDTRFIPSSAVRAGEIVTFVNPIQPTTLLTHQIVGVVQKNHSTYIKTQGKANKQPDPFLTPKTNIVGIYHFAIPYLGYVIVFLKTRWLWILEMAAGLVLIDLAVTRFIRPSRKGAQS